MLRRPSATTGWSRFLVLAAALAALAGPSAASAHSTLIATEPEKGSVVEESPDHVALHFDEAVETALGSIRVFDANGRRVDAETISQPKPNVVTVEIDDALARGTYTVAWRAISADSDPISGAFVFHVQAPGAQPGGIAAQVLEGTPLLVSVLYTGGRFLDFALLLLAVGGVASLALALTTAAAPLRARLWRVVAVAAVALAVVAVLGIFLQGAAAGGFGVREAFRPDVFSSVAGTRFGEFSLLRAALALVLALVALAFSRAPEWGRGPAVGIALALAFGLVVTPSFSGHASVVGPLALVADIVHVQAAAAWTGGLAFVVLALLLARADRWPLASRSVPRFSTMAVVAVAVLIVAGTINGYLQVRAWRGLWETQYGLLLLAKLALVVPVLGLGAFNNRYVVPRLRDQIASAREQRRFLRAAGAELAVMVAIVGVTAVLVNAPPARTEIEMAHRPVAKTTEIGDLELHVAVDPAKVGSNEIHLRFSDPGGGMVRLAEVNVSATLPAKGIGPLRLTARPGGPHGAFVVRDADLAIAGDWQLRVEARRGEFELLTALVAIEIREEI